MPSRTLVTLPFALFNIVSSAELPTFDDFVQQHSRSYRQGSDEYVMRRSLYEQRKNAADAHNANSDRLWTAGANKLSDWTAEEFLQLRGWDGSARPENGGSARSIQPHSTFLQRREDFPAEKIWDNLVTTKHTKNQGGCGSCWAVATATVLEAHSEIHTGSNRTFSAQQIVECTPNPRHCGGDGGCKGATAELAMEWVLRNGCAEESKVPYLGMDGACTTGKPLLTEKDAGETPASQSAPPVGEAFGMVGWETLAKNKYEPLVRALVERGPVAVSVAASEWMMYDSGIFNGCGKDAIIDHAVTAIGYGIKNNVKFWLIQNSWGDDWGENGHIRLLRNENEDTEYCGMNTKPQLGVACKGETEPVPVCGMCGVLFDSVVPHFQAIRNTTA